LTLTPSSATENTGTNGTSPRVAVVAPLSTDLFSHYRNERLAREVPDGALPDLR